MNAEITDATQSANAAEAAVGKADSLKDEFEWLNDIEDNEDYYLSFDWNRLAKSSDFGCDGTSASVTDWHELLQLTAFDADCGVVFVRGNYPHDPGAILARTQRRDQEGTWGLKLHTDAQSDFLPEPKYTLGGGKEQGVINYQWPYMRYELQHKNCEPGRYEICSFVKDGTLFQVSRFTPGKLSHFKSDNISVNEGENIEGPSTKPPTIQKESEVTPATKIPKELEKDEAKSRPIPPITFRIGGALRFGCHCVKGRHMTERYDVTSFEGGHGISCSSDYYEKRVDMQLFVNNKAVEIWDSRVPARPNTNPYSGIILADMCVEYKLPVEPEKATVVVTAFSIRENENDKKGAEFPTNIADYLGIGDRSERATKRLWDSCQDLRQDAVPQQDSIPAIARCVEALMSVCSQPLPPSDEDDEDAKSEPNQPNKDNVGEGPDTLTKSNESGSTEANTVQKDENVEIVLDPAPSSVMQQGTPISEQKLEGDSNPTSANDIETAASLLPQTEDSLTSTSTATGAPNIPPIVVGSAAPLRVSEDQQLDVSGSESNKGKAADEPTSSTEPSTSNAKPSWERGIAMIGNIITAQYVDIESNFWKLRFLVKAYNFLETQPFATSTPIPIKDGDKTLHIIYAHYKQRLLRQIRGNFIWLLKAQIAFLEGGFYLLSPFIEGALHRRDEEKLCFSPCELRGQKSGAFQICHITMSIWYCLKYCPDATVSILKEEEYHKQLTLLNKVCSQSTGPGLEVALAHWHHFGCLIEICKKLGPTDWEKSKSQFGLDKGELLKNFEKWQARVIKAVGPSRRLRTHTYSARQEIEDRLALLAQELHQKDSVAASLCDSYCRQRIASRESTTTINPGRTKTADFTQEDKLSKGPPWEVTCLNHHTALKVASVRGEDYEIAESAQDCLQFCCSDFTFIPSWDESDPDLLGHWWDTDVSAIVCSTFLDIESQKQSIPETSEGAVHQTQQITDVVKTQSAMEDSLRKLIKLQQELQDRPRGSVTKPYRWQDSKPPSKYHPRTWLISMDDTPAELFKNAQKKNVALRKGVTKYLEKNEDRNKDRNALKTDNNEIELKTPTWDISNIAKQIPPKDLLFLSVYEFSLRSKLDEQIRGRSDTFLISDIFKNIPNHEHGHDNDDGSGPTNRDNSKDKKWYDAFTSDLWSWLLEDDDVTREAPLSLTDLPPRSSTMLSDKAVRRRFATEHQRRLFTSLTDSLVDCSIKYRIYFVKRCCPTLVNAFMYMWHTEALDAFDDYFGTISRFTEVRDNDTWTTSITLSHWGLRLQELPEKIADNFSEHRQFGDFPPGTVKNLKDTDIPEGTDTNDGILLMASHSTRTAAAIVEEQSSCLVITGDRQGRFWICSLWSSLVDEDKMVQCIREIPHTLQLFIYAQPIGRCLVFLHLLGHLCEKLSEVYRIIVESLDNIVKLGQDVFLQGHGLDWKAENAVPKLKKMLWGLEAFRVLEDKLSSSLFEVRKASTAIENTISQEPGILHSDLEMESKRIKEDFAKRYELLSDFDGVIQMKIKQISGLRDGISTVTNVEDSYAALKDSATALKQNKNIKVLTWLTIIYLPLGFITSLFAAGHDIIPASADGRLFGAMMALFLVFTVLIAPVVVGFLDSCYDDFTEPAVDWLRGKRVAWFGRSKGDGDKDGGSESAKSEGNGKIREQTREVLVVGEVSSDRKLDQLSPGEAPGGPKRGIRKWWKQKRKGSEVLKGTQAPVLIGSGGDKLNPPIAPDVEKGMATSSQSS